MATGSVEPKSSLIESLNLKWLVRLMKSSVGRKAVIGFTGLALCGFLVAHLAGNLLLYGGQAGFDAYAHKLHEFELLPLLELGLLVMFLLHIGMTIVISRDNAAKRGHAYEMKETKRDDRVLPTSSWMFITGLVVLVFLIVHMIDMRLAMRPDVKYGHEDQAFLNTMAVLTNPISQFVYIVGTIFLGLHLSHGFSSAFQSLGLVHRKYTATVKLIGLIFSIVIAAGFCSLPVIIPRMPQIVSQFKAAAEAQTSESAPALKDSTLP